MRPAGTDADAMRGELPVPIHAANILGPRVRQATEFGGPREVYDVQDNSILSELETARPDNEFTPLWILK